MSTEMTTFSDLERMGKVVAASGLFGIKTPEQAIALMMIAQAEGRHPATVANDYHIIQGRAALKADTMLGRFQEKGGTVKWREMTPTKCIGEFSHAQAGAVSIEWNIDMARQANLLNKDNWKNYPRAMLRARTISEGVRATFPSVLCGMYTPEEIDDLGPQIQTPMIIQDRANAGSSLPPEAEKTLEEIAAEEAQRENERKAMKKARAQLNKMLQPIADGAAFAKARAEFQREHGKDIWEKLTHHNETETFYSLTCEHWSRIDGNARLNAEIAAKVREWQVELDSAVTFEDLDKVAKTLDEYPALRDNATYCDMLSAKGREIGHPQFLTSEPEEA